MKRRYIKPEIEIVEFQPSEMTNLGEGSSGETSIPNDKDRDNFNNMF